jgi:hypothetical protein
VIPAGTGSPHTIQVDGPEWENSQGKWTMSHSDAQMHNAALRQRPDRKAAAAIFSMLACLIIMSVAAANDFDPFGGRGDGL